MKNRIKYLGIDIGGAHFKIVGLDEKKSVCFSAYRKCYIWKGLDNLKKEIDYTNSLNLHENASCGITMTAELCDNLKAKKMAYLRFLNYVRCLNVIIHLYKNKKVFQEILKKIIKI